MARRRSPKSVHADRELLRSFQREAASDGVPLSWLIDVPVWSPDFAPVQLLVQAGGYGPTAGSLMFDSEEAVLPSQRAAWVAATLGPSAPDPCGPGEVSRVQLARAIAAAKGSPASSPGSPGED